MGRIRGTGSGAYNDSIHECTGTQTSNPSMFNNHFANSVFGDISNDGVRSLTAAVGEITISLTNRVRCGYGGVNYDSWAFAAPLFNPEDGFTGWCVDSSGNAKNINFNINGQGSDLGGANSFAVCP